MHLRYDNGLDDCIAFQSYHLAHSPHWKRVTVMFRWGIAGLFFVFAALRALSQSWVAVLVWCGVGVLWILMLPGFMLRSAKRNARKLYGEGTNKGWTGWHELEITDEGLVERTEASEQRTRWSAIERLGMTPDHMFVYVSALTAHVIPRASILEGNYESFVEGLKKKLSAIGGSK